MTALRRHSPRTASLAGGRRHWRTSPPAGRPGRLRGMTPAPIEESSLAAVLRPLAEARTLPGVAYASAEVFEWERRHFLAGSWLCVGRAADVPEVGDQRAVTAAGTGLLLVRDEAGTLRG